MSVKQYSKNDVFSDDDLLRLLQLQTRRVMAERCSKAETGQITDDTEGEAEVEGPLDIQIPSQWRFIPEGIELYAWQRECLPIWLSSGRGSIKVATGGGKTLFALAVAQRLQNELEPDLRLVVVVPTIPLMFQWYDELRRGNLPDSAIGLMGGGKELSSAENLRVLLCVLNSARDRLPSFVTHARWADRMLLVVDECHRANAEQARRIFEAKPRYTLGLSATPEQDTGDQGVPTKEAYEASPVGQGLGPIIYEFTLRQSLEAGLLTPFEVWHVGLPLAPAEAAEHERLSREISELRKELQVRHRRSRSSQDFIAWCQSQSSRGGGAATEAERFIGLANRRKRLLYQAGARIDVALGIISESAKDPDHRVIVFHESIAEIERLFLGAVSNELPVVLEHSQLPGNLRDENIEVFRRGIARIIISAKSLVEGFNVPSADLGVIVAASGSVRQRIQSLGRMLRRKPDNRGACVVILYIRDTEDEAIYAKADWESVIGAERNRYFQWNPSDVGETWPAGLKEVENPPRLYRPPSSEADVSQLRLGDHYPARPDGLDLRVDQSNNLRTEDGALVAAPPELVQSVLERNSFRRAHRTWAGHLIVRTDAPGAVEQDWRYLGNVNPPAEVDTTQVIRLRLKSSSGRRVIALEEDRRRGIVRFAQGPTDVIAQLLDWVRNIERDKGVQAMGIYWDRDTAYWLELEGERIPYDGPLAPLEFES